MFLRSLKYDFLCNIRAKDLIIWLIIFPIILGTFFKIAFSKIYDNSTKFSTISVAVVENEKNEMFNKVLDEISKTDEPLLKPVYTDKEKAMKMLENNDVTGIIYTKDLSLSVSEEGISSTIIKSFLVQYKVQEKIITETAKSNPAKLSKVISKLNEEVSCNENIKLTDDKMDSITSYFYNLIAMVAMCGMITGLHVAIENQGNLSDLGARKCCSPRNKLCSIVSSLISSYAAQTICMCICVTFIQFVLKIDFASRLPLVYLSAVISGIMGVSMGFFVGSIGRMSQGIKNAISLSISLGSCFLSGLMIGNIKALIVEKAPWFNEINPASVISDSFYCLQIYKDYGRYTEKLITMIIFTVIFILGGFLMTRRRKYASL